MQISGLLMAANESNYLNISGTHQVAYLSCDEPANSDLVSQNTMLNALMTQNLKAIILYTTTEAYCSLTFSGMLQYTTLLSMINSTQSADVLRYANGSTNASQVQATIIANSGQQNNDNPNPGHTSTPATAMSVLYVVTGIVVLLFLVIITTGAVRAHRHPERYGPRRALGGRPRQSRAKGIAMAMLATIPIVKFGDSEPPKPDVEQELDTVPAEQRGPSPQNDTEHRGEATPAPEMTPADATPGAAKQQSEGISAPVAASTEAAAGINHPGCSICTEDFQVGEDVRVLPCNHQYHPACIDPWLLNVSGTCPLW